MKTFPFVIQKQTGLSGEQAAAICSAAEQYKSQISIVHGKTVLPAKSLIGLIALQVGCGDEIHVIISGEDELAAESGMHKVLEKELA